jgi:hypothetical protein
VIFLTLICSCSNTIKIFESKTKDEKTTITMGNFRSIVYFVVEKKVKGVKEYELKFECECGESKQRLTKVYANSFWLALTDTTSSPVFFDKKIGEDVLQKPLSFTPISHEEVLLLSKGIERSNLNCCHQEDKPISRIIGYLQCNIPLSKSDKH